jgi:hypothetical protein
MMCESVYVPRLTIRGTPKTPAVSMRNRMDSSRQPSLYG